MSPKARLASAALLTLALVAPAQAASIAFHLDRSNLLPNGTPWLEVNIADGTGGAIDFTVRILEPLLSMLDGPNPGIAKFAFNVLPGVQVPLSGIAIDGSPPGWEIAPQAPMDVFGTFTRRLRSTDAHTPLADVLRFSIQVPGDSILDYVDLSKNAAAGASYFSAYVAGIRPDGCLKSNCLTGAFFAGNLAVVPLPAAGWLMLGGAAALAAIGRRRTPAECRGMKPC